MHLVEHFAEMKRIQVATLFGNHIDGHIGKSEVAYGVLDADKLQVFFLGKSHTLKKQLAKIRRGNGV